MQVRSALAYRSISKLRKNKSVVNVALEPYNSMSLCFLFLFLSFHLLNFSLLKLHFFCRFTQLQTITDAPIIALRPRARAKAWGQGLGPRPGAKAWGQGLGPRPGAKGLNGNKSFMCVLPYFTFNYKIEFIDSRNVCSYFLAAETQLKCRHDDNEVNLATSCSSFFKFETQKNL
jgi:hypothetical protein